MKLPISIMDDRHFHKFMSARYASAGLVAFATYHAEIFNKLERMRNKSEAKVMEL